MLYKDLTETEVFKSIWSMEANYRPLDLEMMDILKNLYNNTSKPDRNPTTSDRIYNSRLECWTPINYTAMLVDKISSVLYGRAVTRSLGEGNEVLESNLANIYMKNKASFIRISKVASLCGYGAIRLRRKWDGTITFDTYGFADVTPILEPNDPFGSPRGIVFSSLVDSLPDWAQRQVKPKSSYSFVEIITRNTRDDDGNITALGEYVALVDNKRIDTPSNGINPLGDYLGAVYWRGLDHPFENWGKSDILPLYETLVAINELFTDSRELMTWGIHSPIVVKNADGTPKWEYSPRSIFMVAGDNVSVERLASATQTFSDFATFIELLLSQFHQASRVPSVATGDLDGIGKASSGRAFEIAMIPLAELIDEKETTCIPQELELMREILAKQAYYGDIKGYTTSVDGIFMPDVKKINELTSNAKVEFAPMEFPDPVVGETLSGQVAGRIRSREDAIATLHEEWNQTQIDEEMAKIDAESSGGTDALATNSINVLRDKLGNK